LRCATVIRNSSCSGVNTASIGLMPSATRLITPLSTGIENEADLTIAVSLASTSILKSRYLRQRMPICAGSTGRNFTVLSCVSPTTRRERAMMPPASNSSLGVSKK
jgi:hypothetical protein